MSDPIPHQWKQRLSGLRTEEVCERCGVQFGTPPAVNPCNPTRWNPSAQIGLLRQQLAAREAERDAARQEAGPLLEAIETQQAQIERLQAALGRYGHHLSHCQSQYLGGQDDDCDCGFAAVVAALQ